MARRVQRIERDGLVWRVDGEAYGQVVLAVGPQHAAELLRAHDARAAQMLDAFSYQSITTVWLRFEAHIRLPSAMLGFSRGLMQWVFDRSQMSGEPGLLAVVISADGPHLELGRDMLIARVVAELQSAFGWQDTPQWTQLIIEKRATFACTAGLRRPTALTAARGLWLAGDYVAGDYPATLEGAVRSGVAVAAGITGRT